MQHMNKLSEAQPAPALAADKGLKRNAISFLSSLVIGVSSAAPAYSLASALGTISGIASFATPGIMIVAFVPMVCIATAYFYLNRAEPDCGTTFAWATRSMGPYIGWLGGWAVTVTNIVVMPSLAAIAGQYSFQLAGIAEPSTFEVTLAGVGWIVLMTAICYLGIKLSARTQHILLATEFVILLVFAGFALTSVYGASPPPAATPVHASWFDPLTAGSWGTITEALLIAVFIYWGWDSGVAINEETENPKTAPGRAAVLSTFLLLALYSLVAAAAIAFAGPVLLSQNKANIFAPIGQTVLGAWLGKLLVGAVITSASAATQTTILPAARTALSMAAAGAIPKRFGEIDKRFQSPGFATLAVGAISIAWYLCLTRLSNNALEDSVLALGLPIAFYYALTGVACILYYRAALLSNWKNFLLMGFIPMAGALMMTFLFIRSCPALASSGSPTVLGINAPAVIGMGSLLLGVPLMLLARWNAPEFFKGKKA
jgi:amino acid transporter